MLYKGRLAQPWLEHLLDMQKVTRSSRVPPNLKRERPEVQSLTVGLPSPTA